jgi:hypothetical protein
MPPKKSPKAEPHAMPVAAAKITGVKPLKHTAKTSHDPCAPHAHHAWKSLNMKASYNSGLIIPVPKGKRFVVELVTASISVPAGETVRLRMYTGLGQRSANFDIAVTPQGIVGGNSVFVATHSLRAYADNGVRFNINRDNPHTKGRALICVSGYLVKL